MIDELSTLIAAFLVALAAVAGLYWGLGWFGV